MKEFPSVAALCVASALGLSIAAIANSKWVALNTCQGEIKFGLWEGCALHASDVSNTSSAENITSEVKCQSYDPKPAWLKATIAMMIIGSICLYIATVLVLLPLLPRNICKKDYFIDAGEYSINGAICVLIGIIVWAAKYTDEQASAECEYSVGFYLAVISGILSFLGGCMLEIISRRSKSSEEANPV